MPEVDEVLDDTTTRMEKSVAALERELGGIRTGRASPRLVENLLVDYYGVPTPMNQSASISVPEARLLMIQPWDKSAVKEVEKSIMKSDLGLMPNSEPIPVTCTAISSSSKTALNFARSISPSAFLRS